MGIAPQLGPRAFPTWVQLRKCAGPPVTALVTKALLSPATADTPQSPAQSPATAVPVFTQASASQLTVFAQASASTAAATSPEPAVTTTFLVLHHVLVRRHQVGGG